MNDKTLAIASERIEHKLAEKNAEIVRRQDQLQELTAQRDRVRADADRALTRANEEEFFRLAQELRCLEDKIHFHSSRLDTLNNEMFITDEEYQDVRSIIIRGLDSANTKARDALIKKFDEIFELGDELNNTIAKGNELLRKWEDVTGHINKIHGRIIQKAEYDGYNIVQTLGKIRELTGYQYFRRDGWRPDGR